MTIMLSQFHVKAAVAISSFLDAMVQTAQGAKMRSTFNGLVDRTPGLRDAMRAYDMMDGDDWKHAQEVAALILAGASLRPTPASFRITGLTDEINREVGGHVNTLLATTEYQGLLDNPEDKSEIIEMAELLEIIGLESVFDFEANLGRDGAG